MIPFSAEWFGKYQAVLLWFVNTFFGRYAMRINGKRSAVGKRKIVCIMPDHIIWHDCDGTYSAEFRTHNKFSKRLFFAFYPIWWLCHQWDAYIANTLVPAWNLGFDTLTARPDPSVEVTTVDGYMYCSNTSTWATLVAMTTSTAVDNGLEIVVGIMSASSVAWARIYRSIMLFNTAALTASANISSAVMSLWSYSPSNKADPANWDFGINVYSSAPASDTAVVSGDFDSLGSVPYSANILVDSWAVPTGENQFAFNANGIAAIAKTGVSRFGVKDPVYDNSGVEPAWVSNKLAYLQAYSADRTGTTMDPTLVVTYTLPGGSSIPVFMNHFGRLRR